MSLFTAPIAVAIIAGILAAAISIIDKIVNNYGELNISINDGKKVLTLNGGDTLLSSLASREIFIPSACGGRGSCGACKCRVTSDIGMHLPTEIPYLDKREVSENIRLSCQVKVKTNIDIMIPEDLFNVRKYVSKVKSIKDVTHDIKEVTFDLQGDEISFAAGKYVQLVVPPYGKIKGSTQRAYSMSSRPDDKGIVELLIRLVPGGIATTWVHNILQAGQEVELIGPFGDFYRSETDAAMVCVAGGSGMAPFKSILYDMFNNGDLAREVWYFFGARTAKDLLYPDEMRALDEKWKNFHFIPALSEPEEGGSWSGEIGLITDVLDNYLKNNITSEKAREGYLCGSPGMIGACNKVLTANGIPVDKIYFDNFA